MDEFIDVTWDQKRLALLYLAIPEVQRKKLVKFLTAEEFEKLSSMAQEVPSGIQNSIKRFGWDVLVRVLEGDCKKAPINPIWGEIIENNIRHAGHRPEKLITAIEKKFREK